MRFIYTILYFTLKYCLRVFYPRQKLVNTPKEYFGSTIYVTNHASSFMDPLVIASLQRPIVFFMTRSDIFTPVMKPILWASHMFPIYRQQDGEDTKGKNEEVFRKCTSVLKYGRNLMIFGEGFTDDVFIRRLKPLKKGAVRIGFTSLEQINWKKKIYICATGCNYSDPGKMRSEVLVSNSDKICMNDYKQQYLENPNKTINELTKHLEKLLQDQLTHIIDKNMAPFHENVMKLTRKGMNADCSDLKIPLKNRWQYSRNLANWFNKNVNESDETLMMLKTDLEDYFKLLKKFKLEEHIVFDYIKTKGSRTKEIFYLIVLFPLGVLGVIHCGLIYWLIKRFVEKSFKRKVFWSSVKMLLAMIVLGLANIPVIFIFYKFIYPSYLLGFLYYAGIGVYFLSAYMWIHHLKMYRIKGAMKKINLDKFWKKRAALLERIKELIPVA